MIDRTHEYDLFVSYARSDNTSGMVSNLVELIAGEYHAFTGDQDLRVFFDQREIKDGQDWEERLHSALANSKFMLAILSPAYFESKWCRKEWERFVDLEKTRLYPGDAINSIYVTTLPTFDAESNELASDWMRDLKRRQMIEAQPWWPQGPEALEREDVRRRIRDLSESIHARVDGLRAADEAPHNIDRPTAMFTGRTEALRKLRDQLVCNPLAAVTAVQGLAGIGKTTLAGEYAHRYRADYPGGRFLVRCEQLREAESLGMELVRLAETYLGLELNDEQKRNQPWALQLMQSSFQSQPKSLIILDNVSHPEILDASSRGDVLPSLEQVHLLVTTREPESRLGGIAALSLEELSNTEGQELLFRFRPIESDDPQDEEWKAAQEFVRAVGGHALALEIIGVHLKQHPSIRYSAFLDGMRRKGVGHKLDQAGNAVRDSGMIKHPEKLIGPLLEPTLTALGQENPICLRVLQLAAWLPPDVVCIPWLRDMAEADFPGLFDHEPDDPDPWEDDVISKLAGLRLLAPGNECQLARMHQLVQEFIQAPYSSWRETWKRVLSHANMRNDWLCHNWHTGGNVWELLPLVKTAWYWLDGAMPGGSHFSINIACLARDCGNLYEARRLLRRVIEIQKEVSYTDNQTLVKCYSNLAMVEYDLGNIGEARQLLLRVIQDWTETYEADDPTLAKGYSNLAVVELALRNLDEARRLLTLAIEIQEKKYPAPDPQLAISYSILAQVERRLGNPSIARSFLLRSIGIEEQAFGSDHPTLATRYSNLALAEQDLGNRKEARRLFKCAIEIWNRVYGADHPALAVAYSNLAVLERDDNNLDEASRLLRFAVEIEQSTYKDGHPALATSYDNLAYVELELGNPREAVELMRKAYEIYLSKLGDGHPDTKISRALLQAHDPEFES